MDSQKVKKSYRPVMVSFIVLIILVIGVVMGFGAFRENVAFKRNQECAKYLPAIEKKFKEEGTMAPDLSSWSSTDVLKMFYSNSRNSCLYTSHRTNASNGDLIFFYTLTDALSNEILVGTDALMPLKDPDFKQKQKAFFDEVNQFN